MLLTTQFSNKVLPPHPRSENMKVKMELYDLKKLVIFFCAALTTVMRIKKCNRVKKQKSGGGGG